MLLFRAERIMKLGLKSLWMHRLRSVLTILGIVFGVCSVIAMLAIGEGASRDAQRAIARLGSTNLIIETVKPPEEAADRGEVQRIDKYGLTYSDAESIHNTLTNTDVTVPVRIIDQQCRYQRRNVAVKVIGTIPWYTQTSPIKVIQGRFLSSMDLQYQLAVCVIDEDVAKKLFAFEEPMGRHVQIRGDYYRVVGIAAQRDIEESTGRFAGKDRASTTGGGVAGNVYIPVTTAQRRFTEISFQMSGGSGSAAKVELQKIIVKVGDNEQVLAAEKVLQDLLDRRHQKKDYQITIPLALLREAARTRRIFSIVLGSIAAISLLVGGIGIMNIMLATVSERTREIGIRRAVGAQKKDIIIQFLSETLLLTLTGGVMGIVVGSIIPMLVEYFGNMPTVITGSSLVLAFGISAGVGVIFGLYPAYRAANMDPIESLRHE
ncbi:MAG TPA: ABC transporter permease [Sedimentisphaerales bacterium]|nr:ABC transporter permease [Sedimentisphaerales bacterium]